MATNGSSAESKLPGLSQITIEGFKSIEQVTAEIRPLTILAGANSSGKSSLMQPLLLMKQTIEAPYDPEALRLDGRNAPYGSPSDFLAKRGCGELVVEVGLEGDDPLRVVYVQDGLGMAIGHMVVPDRPEPAKLAEGMPADQVTHELPQFLRIAGQAWLKIGTLRVARDRALLQVVGTAEGGAEGVIVPVWQPGQAVSWALQSLLHVTSLRPFVRAYPVANIGRALPGVFDDYMASMLLHWQSTGDERSGLVASWLEQLGLTGFVQAERIDGTRIQVNVGRTMASGADDVVNVADVGIGVSQVLPAVVALVAAAPGQTVYLEQPELHLHPRAQVALAGLLAEAAARGVRAIVETHSDLLLLGVQTLVAEGTLDSGDAILHWFERSDEGVTTITSGEIDQAGRSGEWPSDFADTRFAAQGRYLDAAERQLFGGGA